MPSEPQSNLTKDDLERLLNTAIADYHLTELTQPGDNMGSDLLAVDVTLRTGKVIYLVAKMYPHDALSVEVFNSPVSMRKEIDMYITVIPEFQRIQEDCAVLPPRRLDVFCTCAAARATRGQDDGTRPADESSVILLENLKVVGYASTDRIAGMDLAHAELVVTQLAKFHATAIAIKMNKPLLFRNKIMKTLVPLKVRMNDKDFEFKMLSGYLDGLEQQSPVCREQMDKLRKIFKEDFEFKFSSDSRVPLEPFATIVHNDLWTNNIMFRYSSSTSDDSKPLGLKFVDFQLPSYGSPASDLLFFLFTSVKDHILLENLDYLLKMYHDSFVQWLSVLHCNAKKFSWENFTKELSIFSLLELPHILWMLGVVMADKEEMKNRSKDPRENDGIFAVTSDAQVQRAEQAVRLFSEKGWL